MCIHWPDAVLGSAQGWGSHLPRTSEMPFSLSCNFSTSLLLCSGHNFLTSFGVNFCDMSCIVQVTYQVKCWIW